MAQQSLNIPQIRALFRSWDVIKFLKGHPMTMRSRLSHIGAQWGKAKINKTI
jgi:hypothetical protein